MYEELTSGSRTRRTLTGTAHMAAALKLDGALIIGLALIAVYGLVVLYSASGQNLPTVLRASAHLGMGAVAMLVLAQVNPNFLRRSSPWLYVFGIVLLLVVDGIGYVGKGAQRWLDLGFMRFQPSEIMKLAVPMICAWYMHDRPLPPTFKDLIVMGIMIAIPTAMIVRQPDLGTALLIAASGLIVMLLAGMKVRIILISIPLLGGAAMAAWHFIHDYQRQRILTFLNPENDPLGAGYHIIQSQIAIGEGGLFGKGYMNGSQAQLEFLPERSTDFIFAVIGEEFGLLPCLVLLVLYGVVIGRALYLAMQGQDTFARLTGGTIALSFFVYVFVNSGMVSGILPVVGVPLPLISYGGTSMVTLLAGFGILMSLHSHRKLIGS
jgi:rod shape determining protein RodA